MDGWCGAATRYTVLRTAVMQAVQPSTASGNTSTRSCRRTNDVTRHVYIGIVWRSTLATTSDEANSTARTCAAEMRRKGYRLSAGFMSQVNSLIPQKYVHVFLKKKHRYSRNAYSYSLKSPVAGKTRSRSSGRGMCVGTHATLCMCRVVHCGRRRMLLRRPPHHRATPPTNLWPVYREEDEQRKEGQVVESAVDQQTRHVSPRRARRSGRVLHLPTAALVLP